MNRQPYEGRDRRPQDFDTWVIEHAPRIALGGSLFLYAGSHLEYLCGLPLHSSDHGRDRNGRL